MPWIGGKPVYFFLDDYSLPRVSDVLQRILNSVVFRRSASFFFKVSTESSSTICRTDYSGKQLQDPDDFELTDLGSVTIDLSEDDRARFLDEIFRRRLARESRLSGRCLEDVLGPFDKTWAQHARDIRGYAAAPIGGIEDEGLQSRRVLYHGRKVLLHMWSGDTRDMVRIAQSLLQQLPANGSLALPISAPLQDRVFRNVGGQFLHLLHACTRTRQHGAGASAPHITSWGGHLVKIAEAFKEMALHDLRTREGGRAGRKEPKQAFRIEIVDQFSPDGLDRELYEDLVRYGVFLRDDRGKSIRGAIIPRLYLRRLLIPYFTLTFSTVDNIAMRASDFSRLLRSPEEFSEEWKKRRGTFDVGQGELFG